MASDVAIVHETEYLPLISLSKDNSLGTWVGKLVRVTRPVSRTVASGTNGQKEFHNALVKQAQIIYNLSTLSVGRPQHCFFHFLCDGDFQSDCAYLKCYV